MASRALQVGEAIRVAAVTPARAGWAGRVVRWWWAGWLRYARALAEAEGWGGRR